MRGNVVEDALPFARIRAPHGERHHLRARILHGGADEFERILARAEDEARTEHFAAKLQHVFPLLLFHTISPFALPLGEAFPPSTARPHIGTTRRSASPQPPPTKLTISTTSPAASRTDSYVARGTISPFLSTAMRAGT